MAIIPDQTWEIIARSAGGLPSEAREGVEKAIHDYVVEDGASYNRVEIETREALQRAHDRLDDLTREFNLLEGSPDFRHYNAKGDAATTSLARHFTALREMSATLDQTKERLSKRSRKNWPGIKLGSFFIELLQLRSKYLRIDVPTQATETFNSRPFDQYLELCLGLAEPYSNRGERTAKHKEGVRRAVKSFQQRKADPLYSWQWDDLFPQSEAALMKSRRFRAE